MVMSLCVFYECSGCHPQTQGVLRKVDFGQKQIAENLVRKILAFFSMFEKIIWKNVLQEVPFHSQIEYETKIIMEANSDTSLSFSQVLIFFFFSEYLIRYWEKKGGGKQRPQQLNTELCV